MSIPRKESRERTKVDTSRFGDAKKDGSFVEIVCGDGVPLEQSHSRPGGALEVLTRSDDSLLFHHERNDFQLVRKVMLIDDTTEQTMHGRMIRSFAVTFGLTLGLLGIWIYTTKTAARVGSNEVAPTQEREPFDQKQKIAELTKRIAGQEDKPAGEVFKNIQILKAMPAVRLLKVMELGYSKSLGVNCAHCHVVDQWEKDDKPTKQIAREMIKMAGTINSDYLKNIKNLKSDNPIINWTTCHRGQLKPALNLP